MKKVLSVLMAVLMLSAIFAVAVSAETENPSPEPTKYYTITVIIKGNGTATADPSSVEEGGTTKLVANPDPGSKFIGWTIEGDYEIVEGSLTSPTLVIRPKGDVKVTANFEPTSTGKDTGPKSPTTGYNTQAVIALMAVVLTVSAAVVVVLGKRYFSAK